MYTLHNWHDDTIMRCFADLQDLRKYMQILYPDCVEENETFYSADIGVAYYEEHSLVHYCVKCNDELTSECVCHKCPSAWDELRLDYQGNKTFFVEISQHDNGNTIVVLRPKDATNEVIAYEEIAPTELFQVLNEFSQY